VTNLCRHDFSVGSRNVDPGVEAGSVVSLYDISAVDLVGPNTAVVGTLRSGETILGPTEGMLVLIQKGVFLLDAEPGNKVLGTEKVMQTQNINRIRKTKLQLVVGNII
jgi:hypothetical protein